MGPRLRVPNCWCPTAGDVTEAMSQEDAIELQGTVGEVLKGGLFRVQTDAGHEVLAHMSGKMRRHRIRVVLGDEVTVAVSPYDPTRGRIVFRAR